MSLIAKGIVATAVAAAFKDGDVDDAMGRLRDAVDKSNEEELKVLGSSTDVVSVEALVGGTIVLVKVVKFLGRLYKALKQNQ